MGTGVFPGVKRPKREVDHLPTSSTDIKNKWSYTCTHPIRVHGVDKDKFMFFTVRSIFLLILFKNRDLLVRFLRHEIESVLRNFIQGK